jgi:hypothetical protein
MANLMIDSARLERNLIAVARRYAPTLIPAGWQKQAWTDGYQEFYRVLCEALFPSFGRVSAFYLDQEEPLMVALYGEATPVIVALAGFVTPYVVARQGTRPLEVELVGMMDMILEELEATDLPREEYRRLRDSGASLLRGLLDGGVRQLAITPPARPIFDEMNAQRPSETRSIPSAQKITPPQPADLPEPPLPPDLPEDIQPPASVPETLPEPARRFDPDAVPIFFNPGQRGTNQSVPPVPPLPRRG